MFFWIMHFILYGHLNCLWDIFVLRKRIVDNHICFEYLYNHHDHHPPPTPPLW